MDDLRIAPNPQGKITTMSRSSFVATAVRAIDLMIFPAIAALLPAPLLRQAKTIERAKEHVCIAGRVVAIVEDTLALERRLLKLKRERNAPACQQSQVARELLATELRLAAMKAKMQRRQARAKRIASMGPFSLLAQMAAHARTLGTAAAGKPARA